MARLSMNEVTTYRWSFEEDVSNYLAAGITAIGVWRQKLSDFGEERGVELLAESGLAVSNLQWAGGFTGSDGRTLRESVDDAHEAMRLAAALHAGCLVIYSGSRAGHTHNHARRLLQEALRELLPLAEDLDVTLAIEPMHAECAGEWTFLTSLADTLAFLDRVGNSRLKLTFDTYHLGYDERVLDLLAEAAPRVAVVHLGDGREPPQREQSRCAVGHGALPLKEMVQALSSAGYDGYYDVELMGEEIEAANYQELIEQSKNAFAHLLACQVAR